MDLSRRLSPERLDLLAGSDPRAIRSRADLRRINRIIGSRNIILHAIRDVIPPPRHIVDLGAGDGTQMLAVAQEMASEWPDARVVLVDRQHVVGPQTIAGFHKLGWHPEIVKADVLSWLAQPDGQYFDLVIANLFLHHFPDQQLMQILACIATRCNAFFACEPKRARIPLLASHLVFLIGANDITREDSVTSVHAGFLDQELSALWPAYPPGWQLKEYAAGLFSHCLLALRQQA